MALPAVAPVGRRTPSPKPPSSRMTRGAARHLAEAKARADRRSALARHQATGHRADQPIARLLAGFEPRATAAGTCRARRRGEPGASAAHRRRSARTTATLRSRARSGLARPRPYWPPGWRRCSRPEVPTAMLHLCVPTENRARSVVDAATIIPSTDSGVRAATQPGCPCNSTSPGAYEGRHDGRRSDRRGTRCEGLARGHRHCARRQPPHETKYPNLRYGRDRTGTGLRRCTPQHLPPTAGIGETSRAGLRRHSKCTSASSRSTRAARQPRRVRVAVSNCRQTTAANLGDRIPDPKGMMKALCPPTSST
jgi:hypothetical protein